MYRNCNTYWSEAAWHEDSHAKNVMVANNMIIGDNNACGIYVGNTNTIVVMNNRVTNCATSLISHVIGQLECKYKCVLC